jgi:hypothetical protein
MVDVLAPNKGLTLDAQYRIQIFPDPVGGLDVGASGLFIKSGGILSGMIGAGQVLGSHVGFDDDDIPNTSAVSGASVKDALDTIDADFLDYLKHDGSIAMSGDLAMGGFKVTGMGAGAAPSDAVTLQQLQDAVALGIRWRYPTAYAGVGVANGALKPAFMRATQTLHFLANPNPTETITIAGAVITFIAVGPPGPNQCVIGGSAAVTAANLVAAINSATDPIDPPFSTALGNAVYAIREQTGTGQTVHLVWLNDDPARTPTDANGRVCSTTAGNVQFVNQDISANFVFNGAYDSVLDGATVQARHENAIFQFNLDVGDWELIFANPGSGFFGKVIGDSGGLQTAGTDDTLYIEGDLATIDTVSSFFLGPKITISHRDASGQTAPYHSEDSIILGQAYPSVGTSISDEQKDFNAAADVLLGDLKSSALQNILVNGSFLYDPVPGPYTSVAASSIACTPGWAIRDLDGSGMNSATVTHTGVGPGPVVGADYAEVDITALLGGVKVMDFYQPILWPELYSGRKVSFRVAVFANSNVQAFIKTSAGDTLGDIHTGSGTFEVLTVTTTLASPETTLEFGLRYTAVDTTYVDAATVVVGAGFTDLPFIAKDAIEDRHMVAAMYQEIPWSQCVWVATGPGGTGGNVNIQYAIPMILPGGGVTFNLSADPPGDTAIAVLFQNENGLTFDLTSAIGYGALNVVAGTIIIDARPT